MAAKGQSLEDWTSVEKSLPPPGFNPWANEQNNPVSFAPPTITAGNKTSGANPWKPLRKPNPEPTSSPWGAPVSSPWGAPVVQKSNDPEEEEFPTLGSARPRKF